MNTNLEKKQRVRTIRSDKKETTTVKRAFYARVKVNFFLKVPRKKGAEDSALKDLYCRIVYNADRCDFFTNISIPPFAFENKRIKPLTDEYIEYQKMLDSIALDALKIENDLRSAGASISCHIVRDRILLREKTMKNFFGVAEMFLEQRKQLVGKDILEVTFRRNSYWLNEILEFSKSYFQQPPMCYEIGEAFARDLFQWLRTKKNLSHDLCCRRVELVKRILDFAVLHNYLQTENPLRYVRFKRENKPKLCFLSVDEVRKLKSIYLEDLELESARDCFLFQIFTGLAYGDLRNLNRRNIHVDPKGQKWLKIERSKTKNTSMVPLIPEAQALIEKYKGYQGGNMKFGAIFPVMDHHLYSSRLKILGTYCNIPPRLMCSHTGRKTFATIALNSGKVSIESVAQMLGHANTKTTSKFYAQVNTTRLQREMENFNFFGYEGK